MVLEEEISLIFGLTLVQIVEYVAMIGIAIAASSFIVTAYYSTKQSKVSSANLILELLKPWRSDKFKHLLDQISDPQIKKYDLKETEEFLNQFEDIATFSKDGTLSENHVIQFFGPNLKDIRDDDFIQNFIKKWVDKDPDFYFINLRKLIKELTDKRKI